jgi:thiol-disulfide isomerase/thioredoxin
MLGVGFAPRPVLAQIPQAPAAASGNTLKVGDKAPALSIEHWVKGEPVKTFEPGKVYVVEFWATWCGPCIKNMPHLTKLQKRYQDKGLTIIGVSSQDRRGIDDVRPFVERRGDIIGYTIAVDRNMETARAYMAATGQQAIPAAYIVDKQGKLAWYGHPMDAMDLVIDELVNDRFDPAKHAERMARYRAISEQFSKAAQAEKWDDALKSLDELKSVRPDLANQAEVSRFAVLRMGKKDADGAAAQRTRLLREVLVNDADTLRNLAEMLQSIPTPTPADRAAAVEGAQALVSATKEKDAQALSLLARAYKAAGQWDQAISAQQKAVEASESDGMRQTMRRILDELQTARKASEAATPAAAPAEPAKSDK